MGLYSTAVAALNTICGLVSEGEGHLRRILCVCVFVFDFRLEFSLGLILEFTATEKQHKICPKTYKCKGKVVSKD